MKPFNLTHQFLIAMPSLMDPNFHRTVTYICAHSEQGAMGIIINRPASVALGEVLSQMDLTPSDPRLNRMAVYEGGPVQRDRGFIIFKPLGRWESTIKINEHYGVATSRDILEAMCEGKGPERTLVALGYAGWGAGQLEREMAENAWLSSPADEDILFETPPQIRWESAAALLGVDIDRISLDVGHA